MDRKSTETARKPNLKSGYLGPQKTCNEVGLTTRSHKDPEFRVNDNEVEIKFRAKSPVRVTHELIDCYNERQINEFVLTQTQGDIVSFVINFPDTGYYKFQIYAQNALDNKDSVPNVFNYVINCARVTRQVYPFPKQYRKWKEDCFLYEPKTLHPDWLADVHWKVSVPQAFTVAVVAEGEWFNLDKKGNSWEGRFSLDEHQHSARKITLNACFSEQDDRKFDTLLEYKL